MIIAKTGKSAEVKIPFSRLIPTKFARTAAQSTPFDSSRVTAVQLTLSKFEYDGGLNPKFKEVQQRLCYFQHKHLRINQHICTHFFHVIII